MSDQNTTNHDELLDHDFDGIREYDNPLPGWWVWLFIGTIIFCVPYVMWYHLGKGDSIHEAYDADLVAYQEALIAQFGDLTGDEATIIEKMNDAGAMAAMAGSFKAKCARCHKADGSGIVGPNLTDEYWLNVKNVEDIYTILTEGLVSKGMPAWSNEFTDTQRVLLSSYVAKMRETPLAGKEPQGEAIAPWPTLEELSADDTGTGDAGEGS
jgi:cytochrome c oxidase cbb3-type subunit 3